MCAGAQEGSGNTGLGSSLYSGPPDKNVQGTEQSRHSSFKRNQTGINDINESCFVHYHQERALLSCNHTPAWELPVELNNLEVEDLFHLLSN